MKKKLKVILPIIIILITIVGVGSLLAYLTSKDHKTNIFTLGRVKIELNEANWDASLATNLKPNDSIEKDPTIKNIGRNQAYVYLKVLTPIVELMNNTEGPLFTYTPNEGWTELSSINDCNYQIKTYYYNTALSPNDSTTSLFDTVTLANFGPNVETIQDMIIYGYAIQTNYLQNGTTIPTIFTSHFSNDLSDTTITCPGMVRDYNGEGCATITNDSSGGGGNANMSGLTLMMKNKSLGTDEDIDFSLPAGKYTDNNFSEITSTNGPANTTTHYYTYADSYSFDSATGKFSLTNPRVGLYSDIYSSLIGKYIVSTTGSTSSTAASSSNLTTIYKVTKTDSSYIDTSFVDSSYYINEISSTYQDYYFTYADSYSFDSKTGEYSLINPKVGKYSAIYNLLPGKYIYSYIGEKTNRIRSATELKKIYKVKTGTTLSSLYYQTSSLEKPITYITSLPANVTIENNGQGVYTRKGTENDKYPIYYYRGTLDLSNNIVFGGFCWKIVRTTATGGIRIVYNGVVNKDNSCGITNGDSTNRTSNTTIKLTYGPIEGDNYTFSYTNNTGDIYFSYNQKDNDSKFSGYMYETNEENDTDSNLKRALDTWYSATLNTHSNKIEDAIYCNDRTYESEENEKKYCTYKRIEMGQPTTLCSRKTDAFGVNSGNKYLTYKVGFLTADEVNMAGECEKYNSYTYLYNSIMNMTGSPFVYVDDNYHDNYLIFKYGSGDKLMYLPFEQMYQIRPVITLKANTSYTGTGTLANPFIVN